MIILLFILVILFIIFIYPTQKYDNHNYTINHKEKISSGIYAGKVNTFIKKILPLDTYPVFVKTFANLDGQITCQYFIYRDESSPQNNIYTSTIYLFRNEKVIKHIYKTFSYDDNSFIKDMENNIYKKGPHCVDDAGPNFAKNYLSMYDKDNDDLKTYVTMGSCVADSMIYIEELYKFINKKLEENKITIKKDGNFLIYFKPQQQEPFLY